MTCSSTSPQGHLLSPRQSPRHNVARYARCTYWGAIYGLMRTLARCCILVSVLEPLGGGVLNTTAFSILNTNPGFQIVYLVKLFLFYFTTYTLQPYDTLYTIYILSSILSSCSLELCDPVSKRGG